jgi:hypothetical protein
MAQAATPEGSEGGKGVFLPPRYVLRRRHVDEALEGVPDDVGDVTVWIHSSTLGIEKKCFDEMECVSRILVWGPEQHGDGTPSPVVAAAALRALVKKLAAYEPALVDHIHELVATHMGNDDEMHRIGDTAFIGCRQLREVVLPRSITHVDDEAFHGCTSLTSVTLPDALTHVGNAAFRECTSLTSVTLPDALTHVDKQAFWRCISLTSVTLPNSLTHIGKHAFYGTSLVSVTLPCSLPHFGEFAFSRCTSLTSVTLSDSLAHIGDFAFWGCTSLERVTMPAARPFIGNGAFHGCPWHLSPTTAP